MSQCIVVIGAHRSGTSAIMGALHHLNVYIGSEWITDHYEHSKIVPMNDQLLSALKSSWDDPFPLQDNWWKQSCVLNLKKQLLGLVVQEFGRQSLWGLKDPRLCILLPLWLDIFKELGIEPLFILPLRNPLEVSVSHQRRDHFGNRKALLLWLKYFLSAEHYSRGYKRFCYQFDDLLGDPRIIVERISEQLNVDFPRSLNDAMQDIQRFLKPDLRHHNCMQKQPESSLPQSFLSLHKLLFSDAGGIDNVDNNRAVIDEYRADFMVTQRFFLNDTLKEDWVKLNGSFIVLLDRMMTLGGQMIQDRQHARAIKHFSALIDLLPGNKALWNNLGIAYEHSASIGCAHACFSKALEIDPRYKSAIDNLKRIEPQFILQKNNGAEFACSQSGV